MSNFLYNVRKILELDKFKLPQYTPSQKAMHSKVRNIIPQARQTFQDRGGWQGGIDRVRQSKAKDYFLPTASPTFRKYIHSTAESVPQGVKSSLKLSPPYQAYRAVTQPYTGQEFMGDVSNILKPVYRLSQPLAPAIGTGMNIYKSARQGKTSPEQILQAGYQGVDNQPGVGETLTDNPKAAMIIDIAFMATMIARPYLNKKLNQLNLKANEINKVSATLGVKPTDSLDDINNAWKSQVTKYRDTFAGRGSASDMAKVKDLNNAHNILKNTGVMDRQYATAYNFMVNTLPQMNFGLSIKAKPRNITGTSTETAITKPMKPGHARILPAPALPPGVIEGSKPGTYKQATLSDIKAAETKVANLQTLRSGNPGNQVVMNALKKAEQQLAAIDKPMEQKQSDFLKMGEGQTPFEGLMRESPTQTQARRDAQLTPQQAYGQKPDPTLPAISELKPDSRAWIGEPRTESSPAKFQQPVIKKTSLSDNVINLNDITPTKKGFRDVFRNFREVYGSRYPEVKEAILDPFDKGKGDYVAMQKSWTDDLKLNVVDKYGFKKGSKESAAIQQYGEGIKSMDDLIEEFGKVKARHIVESSKWFRSAYDRLLNQVNKTRKAIYPNNPDMIIPKRKDYFRHFNELSGLQGFKNIFESQAGVDPLLVGISDFTTPRSKWQSFAQRRITKGNTTYDAIGGFLEYLPKASYSTYIDPHINKFRDLGNELAVETSLEGQKGMYKKLNNFVEFLEDFSNDLAGKTNPLDRGVQKYIPGGRKTFAVINWANSRVKANVILGNLSSSIAQIFNVPQGIASAGEGNFIKGGYDAVIGTLRDTKNKSSFLKERYAGDIYKQFDSKIIDQPKKLAVWVTGILDEAGTNLIWNAHYRKALGEGIEKPIKFADDITREMVAGRGIGEVAIAQKSKLFQLVAPFQVEVGNLWWVMKDFVNDKQFHKLAKFFIYAYLFNEAAEKIRGSRVTIDPIDAVMDAVGIYREEDNKKLAALKVGGRLTGEALSNIPGGQTVAAMYPEYGFNIGDKKAPTRSDLFGEGDPTKYGTGLMVTKGLQDPLYKLIPAWGGQQLKKTVGGIKALNKGESQTSSGKMRFLTPESTTGKAQTLAFGEWGSPEARKYFDKDRRPLSEKQSKLVREAKDKLATYQEIQKNRELSKEEDRVKDLVRTGTGGSHYAPSEKYFYLDTDSGDVKTIDLGYEVEKPEQTGNYELDKKLRSKFYGECTKKANFIVASYEQGLIDEKEAEKQLEELAKLKASVKGGSGGSARKISIKTLPYKKGVVKFKKTPKATIKGLNLSRPPTLKPMKTAKII